MNRIKRITGLAVAAVATAGVAVVAADSSAQAHPARPATVKPTIVLIHGAWADASGWTPVAEQLEKDGYAVKAPPNPLRGLISDAAYVHSVLSQINGPVILVGHSYGGAVITNAAVGASNVKALVYIAAFAPDQGDSLASLNAMPVAHEIPPVPTVATGFPKPDGSTGIELTIDPARFSSVFLDNELSPFEAEAFAAEQRPLSFDAVTQTSGTPAWQTIPSWYMVATKDHAIAPDLERFMAARARAHTVQVDGPHLIMFTNAGPVTSLIEQAATSTVHQ